MKILKEAKEQLPVSFLTDFISDCWEKVGYLKSDIESIATFDGSKEISNIIQGLIDAYLICLGQLEAHAHGEGYIEAPTATKPDANIATIANVPEQTAKALPDQVEVVATETQPADKIKLDAAKLKVSPEILAKVTPAAPEAEQFEYFVDFDEPIPDTGDKLTDKDIEKLLGINS